MLEPTHGVPAFDLWSAPWIMLERPDGGRDRRGIEETLLGAQEYTAVYESSPLVVAGIHRLLTAILQAAIEPQRPAELRRLWAQGRFPAQAVRGFAERYAERFDLFSAETPFLQSADLPLRPSKGDKVKTVAYLTPEIPAVSEVGHFRHGRGDEQAYCPACAAGGLLTIPAFATAGGSGIKPSINGVPPIYVLPGGRSLFESLAASVVLPEYQPEVAWREGDAAWWARVPIVERGREVLRVGYLHSLTFPARRVRLHPERVQAPCTRCGVWTEWGVRTMIFEMGESRPKGAPFWFDPFAAYQLPASKSGGRPKSIRLSRGGVAWREFASLFLQSPSPADRDRTRRPRVLDQMADLGIAADAPVFALRCVGVRTDQAKFFEWSDMGFDVPPPLLSDNHAAVVVNQAVKFSTACAWVLGRTFDKAFAGPSAKAKRHRRLRADMQAEYWSALAEPFREFILRLASLAAEGRKAELSRWLDTVVHEGHTALVHAAAAVGDDGVALRHRVEAEHACELELARRRKEYSPYE